MARRGLATARAAGALATPSQARRSAPAERRHPWLMRCTGPGNPVAQRRSRTGPRAAPRQTRPASGGTRTTRSHHRRPAANAASMRAAHAVAKAPLPPTRAPAAVPPMVTAASGSRGSAHPRRRRMTSPSSHRDWPPPARVAAAATRANREPARHDPQTSWRPGHPAMATGAATSMPCAVMTRCHAVHSHPPPPAP